MLWCFPRPLKMMMTSTRSNAFYKFWVALSLLFALLALSPVELAASTTRLRRSAQDAAKKPSTKKHAPSHSGAAGKSGGKPAAKKAAPPGHAKTHKRRKRQVDDETDPVTINRIHAWEKAKQKNAEQQPQLRSHNSSSVPAEQVAAQQQTAAQNPSSAQNQSGAQDTKKATAEDFLKAASPAPASDAPATGVSKPVESDEAGPRTQAPSISRQRSAAKPAAVVSVVRTTTEHPQLPPVEQVASTPQILPSLYNKRGRLIVPRPLKGSREILLRQNQMADSEGLDRIRNDEDIDLMRQQRTLVALPVSPGLEVDERLAENRRYCRPWTAEFLRNLAQAHYARFHTPLQVNSAVRTVEFQQRLQRTNGNAAPAEGDLASPHLTGQTIDLAKHGLSLTEIAWMRGYLLPLVQQGKMDVEEEFQQSCFHISVYKRYLPSSRVPRREIATTHRAGTSALATAVP